MGPKSQLSWLERTFARATASRSRDHRLGAEALEDLVIAATPNLNARIDEQKFDQLAAATRAGADNTYQILILVRKRMSLPLWKVTLKSLQLVDFLLHRGSMSVLIWVRDNIDYIKESFPTFENHAQARVVTAQLRLIEWLIVSEDRINNERDNMERHWLERSTKMPTPNMGWHAYGPDNEPVSASNQIPHTSLSKFIEPERHYHELYGSIDVAPPPPDSASSMIADTGRPEGVPGVDRSSQNLVAATKMKPNFPIRQISATLNQPNGEERIETTSAGPNHDNQFASSWNAQKTMPNDQTLKHATNGNADWDNLHKEVFTQITIETAIMISFCRELKRFIAFQSIQLQSLSTKQRKTWESILATHGFFQDSQDLATTELTLLRTAERINNTELRDRASSLLVPLEAAKHKMEYIYQFIELPVKSLLMEQISINPDKWKSAFARPSSCIDYDLRAAVISLRQVLELSSLDDEAIQAAVEMRRLCWQFRKLISRSWSDLEVDSFGTLINRTYILREKHLVDGDPEAEAIREYARLHQATSISQERSAQRSSYHLISERLSFMTLRQEHQAEELFLASTGSFTATISKEVVQKFLTSTKSAFTEGSMREIERLMTRMGMTLAARLYFPEFALLIFFSSRIVRGRSEPGWLPWERLHEVEREVGVIKRMLFEGKPLNGENSKNAQHASLQLQGTQSPDDDHHSSEPHVDDNIEREEIVEKEEGEKTETQRRIVQQSSSRGPEPQYGIVPLPSLESSKTNKFERSAGDSSSKLSAEEQRVEEIADHQKGDETMLQSNLQSSQSSDGGRPTSTRQQWPKSSDTLAQTPSAFLSPSPVLEKKRSGRFISDLVRDSKLQTAIGNDEKSVRHISYVSNPRIRQRRLRKEETWTRRRELGSGSFGCVWLEECLSGEGLGKFRAVKGIAKTLRDERKEIDYNRELEAIAKFSHSNYVHCFVESFGWYESDQMVFITMEYLEKGDLESHLTKPFPEDEVKQIIFQLLEGLSFMHENGFAHRDLKPPNILVSESSPNWWVKIGDFGISKRAEEEATAFRTLVGTKGYLAPEVLGIFSPDDMNDIDAANDDHSELYTVAVDLWALGAILFRALTHETVFRDPRQLARYVTAKHPFPTATAVQNGATEACIRFLEEVMARSPNARPSSRMAMSHEWLSEFHDSIEPSEELLESLSLSEERREMGTRLTLDYDTTASASWSTYS